MADDDIDRLLREVAASTGTPSSTPQPVASSVAETGTPAKGTPTRQTKAGGPGGRLAFAAVSAVALGILGWAVGLVLPFLGAGSSGIGAAIGAFVTAMVAGPPRWFSS